MTKGIWAVVLSLVLLGSGTANAALWGFSGGLSASQSTSAVVPDPYFGGGVVFATLDDATGDFTWEYIFAETTSDAFLAHFHEAPPGADGPPKVTLTVPAPAATSGHESGATVLAGADLAGAIEALTGDGTFGVGSVTDWYLNIHTLDNLGGELRGQLIVSAVPVPAAVWMLGSALCALFGVRRFS